MCHVINPFFFASRSAINFKKSSFKFYDGESVPMRRLAHHLTDTDGISYKRYSRTAEHTTKTSDTQPNPKSVHHVPVFWDSPPSEEVKKGWSDTSTPPMYLPGTTLLPDHNIFAW